MKFVPDIISDKEKFERVKELAGVAIATCTIIGFASREMKRKKNQA